MVCGGGGGGVWDGVSGKRVDRRRSWSLSSWSLARAMACGNDIGCNAWTSRHRSGVRPEMKQLKRSGCSSPMVRLVWRSNSER